MPLSFAHNHLPKGVPKVTCFKPYLSGMMPKIGLGGIIAGAMAVPYSPINQIAARLCSAGGDGRPSARKRTESRM